MKRRLVLVAALSFVAPSAEAVADGGLEGIWNVTRMERGGRTPPPELLKSLKVVVEGKTLKMTDGKRGESATFEVDDTVTPHAIDAVFKEGPNGDVERKAAGIYELDGNVLKVAWRKDGGPRPTVFATPPGERTSELWVLEREPRKE